MTFTDKDKEYMSLALSLAHRGISRVEPNPMVGAVIVKDEQVIGQGFHESFGRPHAEINALYNCKTNGCDPAGATMYVTLEPCCHTGKTPPCTDAIINAKIARVIAAAIDPSSHAGGRGIALLKEKGIDTAVGLMEAQAVLLNAAFFKFAETDRPWVIGKWAQSIDGVVAAKDKKWISSPASRADVHNIRRSCQGILVGLDTVIADNPMLTPRPDQGKTPTRIVMDSNLQIPLECRLLQTANYPTLVVTTIEALSEKDALVAEIFERGADILAVASGPGNRCDIDIMLSELGKKGLQRLLVEGGPTVMDAFLAADLLDEARIYIAPEPLAEKAEVFATEKMKKIAAEPKLHYIQRMNFNGDTCITGHFRKI
jgi:diaminohydroxyphosphoribosylaminopyrimidine deaminase/5-amino-6-(5-phosphoribosylamino)uracil reductase